MASTTSYAGGEDAWIIVAMVFGGIAAIALLIFLVALFMRLFTTKEVGTTMVVSAVITIICIVVGGISAFTGWQMARGRGITLVAEQVLRQEGFNVIQVDVSGGWAQVIAPGNCVVNVNLNQRPDVPAIWSFYFTQHGVVVTAQTTICH
jgi:hypothetical protein